MLTLTDYQTSAKHLRCDVAAVQAVAEVEAPRGGFLATTNACRILFEGQHFHRFTGGKFDRTHPTLSYPKWTKAFYARGKDDEERGRGEWDRLTAAMKIDRQAALMSASWGKFQIMGLNFTLCGFTSIDDFVAAMQESEQRHLEAFVEYIISVSLDDELRTHNWAAFARKYNGPLYERNAYDAKLAAAHTKFQTAA